MAGHERRGDDEAEAVREAQREPCAAIRPATAADFEGIMLIENACFPGELAYSRDEMALLLGSPDSATFVEESGGRLSGYVTAVLEPGTGTAGIETIGVAPHARGGGVGSRLLSAAEECMSKRGASKSVLEVSAGNAAAITLYSKTGYAVRCELPEYYIYEHNGTRHALRMEKPLRDSFK